MEAWKRQSLLVHKVTDVVSCRPVEAHYFQPYIRPQGVVAAPHPYAAPPPGHFGPTTIPLVV
ncbi:hypothetical protein M8C21_017183 [Ambrosia artemisiifolia]|uniref:Uncharacterized protein n=1 Tax=Ambrosia artemisiifolia TaxID=4212 RepID=A0AAD5C0U2_AMBAR|nr:hypothetical protein M8C21_017183 [Ambrosia artemisiifolia]